MKQRQAPIRLTDAAAARLKTLIGQAPEGTVGLRVGVKSRGCSGLSYTLDYASDVKKFDEVVEEKGVRVVVDAGALMFLVGTEMDWVEDRFGAHFAFTNPNEVDRCGCGESFRVAGEEARA